MKIQTLAAAAMLLVTPGTLFSQNPPEVNPKGYPTPKALTVLEQQFNSEAARILVVGIEQAKVETLLRLRREAKQPLGAELTRSQQLKTDWARMEKTLRELQSKIELDRKQSRANGRPCSDVKIYPKMEVTWNWRYVVK